MSLLPLLHSNSKVPQPIGDLATSSDFYVPGNWTIFGTPGVTFNANSINFNAAGLFGNHNNGIAFNPITTCRNKMTWQCDLTPNTLSYGFSLSFRPYTNIPDQGGFHALFGFNSTFGVGIVSLRRATTIIAQNTYSGAITAGNTYRIKLEFSEGIVRCSMQNLTTGFTTITVAANFIYTYPFTQPFMQQTYKVGLCIQGGNYTVANIKCSSDALTYGYLLLGNSKTATAFPTSFALSFISLLKASNPSVPVQYDASVNETVDDQLARITDLLKYKPIKVFLVDSSNEPFSTSNIATKMTSLKNQFNAIGTPVIYCNTMPELRQNANGINGIVQPVFAPNVIDLYSLTVDPANIPRLLPAYASPDGNHGNAAVQPVIAAAIDPFIP